MMQGRVEEKPRKKGRAKGIPLTSNLPPDERLRVFINFAISLVKEEQAKSNLNKLIYPLEVKNA